MSAGSMKRPPPYGIALLAALAAWALYALTLAPTTAFWDTSEYIATAHIVGIPHPPGNPLFVIVARVWSVLLAPLGLPVAVRINLLAATTSAAATGFLYLVAHRVLSGLSDDDRFARVGAGAAALVGATAFTVWNQSTVNEKVYTVSVLIIAAVSWLAVRWHDSKDQPGSARYLLWAVFLIAIGATNHPMSILPAPALAVFVLVSRPSVLLRPQVLGRAALLVVLGLSFNFVLPVRAALDPAIDEGEPTCDSALGAAGAIYERLLPGPLRGLAAPLPKCRALADNLARVQYQTPPVTARKAPFRAQLHMYWQYFDWQWSRGMDASPVPGTARLPFTLLFLALGGAGLWAVWRSDRAIFAYLVVLVGTLSIGLVVYLNFKYGYSLAREITNSDLHEVRERDYFYVAGFLIWGSLAGMGLAWTWHTLAGVGRGARRYFVTAPVLLIAFFPITLNWRWASRAGDYAAHDWAYDLLLSVEPYGVLFTNGDNDTFPLWYMQEVEGVRRDVTVIVGQYLLTDWYPRQLERMTLPENQRRFDAVAAGGLYEDRPVPSSAITAMTGDEMDLMQGVRLPDDLTVPFPRLAVTYPKGSVLNRSHLLALRIIHDSIAQRPIYFSAQGGMLSELGLDRWGVRQGLVTKLEPRGNAQMAGEGLVQGSAAYGGIWFDLDRSLRLYDDVYKYRGIRDRPIWQDASAVSIPLQYYAMAALLADAAKAAGETSDTVSRLEDDAVSFQLVARGGLKPDSGL
jgi:Protein O-mannosyl-transferase TMEM260-like